MSKSSRRTAPFAKSFFKSQFTGIIGGGVDYLTLIAFTEILGVWYVASTAIGAFVGAVVHFLLSRHWSFSAVAGGFHGQAARYFLVSFANLVLNTAGVYLLTEHTPLPYQISKLVVSLGLAFGFCYPLQRCYVFALPDRS